MNEVAVTDPLDHTISTVYDAEDRVLAQRGTTYPVGFGRDPRVNVRQDKLGRAY